MSARSPAAPGRWGGPYLACSAAIRVSATRELIPSFPKAAEVSARGAQGDEEPLGDLSAGQAAGDCPVFGKSALCH